MSTYSSYKSKRPIECKIEGDRSRLVQLAAYKGLQHQEVIRESQSLDRLLNEYYAQID
ncbi:MAG: Spo0E family sporulation regulatory protein-aspartic acid phosphatase [Methylocystaceae bacterium]